MGELKEEEGNHSRELVTEGRQRRHVSEMDDWKVTFVGQFKETKIKQKRRIDSLVLQGEGDIF